MATVRAPAPPISPDLSRRHGVGEATRKVSFAGALGASHCVFAQRRLLAYYDYAISTGRLDGTNNKINAMKRQAYGFRDPQFLETQNARHP